MEKISVVIPTCDRPETLAHGLESVVSQTASPFEVIVVDNGTVAVTLQFLPCPVILKRLAPRVGVSRARNEGVRLARGDYIAFLDDDDVWDRDYLAHMLKAIQSHDPQPDLLIGRKDIASAGKRESYKCVRDVNDLMPDLLFRNPGVGGQNIVVRREAFSAIGGFDTELVTSEDRALVLDFIQANKKIVCVPHAVAVIHRGTGEHLTNLETILRGKRQFLKKYRHLMGKREWLLTQSQLMSMKGRESRRHRKLAKWLKRAANFLYPRTR